MNNMNKKRFEKNLKRKKLKQTINSRPALWSVPIPKHNLPSIGGKVRLYHYTPMDRIGSIMTYGLIKGDVYGSESGGRNWNAPNLTSENKFHNPANRGGKINDGEYCRLEIYFDENDRKIVPFGWFDRTYCGDINREVIRRCNDAGRQNGDIDKQYLYKGPISLQMIKKVSVWNEKTGYWDRLSKNEILGLTKAESLPFLTFCGRNTINFDWLRICGFSLNDWTGRIREFYAKTDDREVMQPLYELTDYICDTLKGRRLRDYQLSVQKGRLNGDIENTVRFVIKTYNEISKEPVDREWEENLRARQHRWYKELGDRKTTKLKEEFEKAA